MDFMRERLEEAAGRAPSTRVPKPVSDALQRARGVLIPHDEYLERKLGSSYRAATYREPTANAG
jgi:hypothetical protein